MGNRKRWVISRSANDPIADFASTCYTLYQRDHVWGALTLRWLFFIVGVLAVTACDGPPVDGSPVIDRAPYESVADADALTVKNLEASGYSQADFYPVGCVIPDQPDAVCDATGAVFMDQREFYENDIAIEDEEYGRYEFVCPAIDGQDIATWKCRKQENNHR